MKTIVDYAQLVKNQHALNISLAPVEADPTASSKPYAIGQHFILNGELYKAKTAIALGDALVLDTNYEAAGSIEAQIETLDAENQTLTNEVNDIVNVLGAKNLLPNDATSQTVSGVTFIVNSDGTVTVNGTATAQINFSIKNQIPTEWIGKSLILSGCPSGGGSDKYELVLWDGDASGALMRDFGNGASGIPLHTNSWVNFTIRSGATFNNAIVKPMIRPASIEDDTYVPYVMTNRELTEVKSYTIDASTYANAFNFRKIGNVVQVQLPAIKNDIPVATTVTIGNLPSDLIPLVNSQFQSEDPSTGSNAVRYNFTAEGALTIYRYSGTVGTGALMNVGGTGVYLTK